MRNYRSMAFLNLFKKGRKGKDDELFKNIQRDVDPKSLWEIMKELGEGSFGLVHKVRFTPCSPRFQFIFIAT